MGSLELDWDELRRFRRTLHRRPELSGEEVETAEVVRARLSEAEPDELLSGLGGHGVAAVWGEPETGPTILLRSELDALPIDERLEVAHSSEREKQAHKCGHDGHMAILLGVSRWLCRHRPSRGRVVLLFQPAEEVGRGAKLVIEDEGFAPFRPDRSFALHNLPGYPLGQVLLRRGLFAAASRGLIARLEGETSHAGRPERGRSPALAVAHAITDLTALTQAFSAFDEPARVTVVGARLGGPAFGTSPGKARLYATVRTSDDSRLDMLWDRAASIIKGHGAVYQLEVSIEATEDFAATINDPDCVDIIAGAAEAAGVEFNWLEHPFPWSEDFGRFTALSCGALFGLGAGLDHPALHSPGYDFPDELIPVGVTLFVSIVEACLDVEEAG